MKSERLNGFDVITPVYDWLARFVFGKSIRNAQLKFLNEIPGGSTILILGGGTGWLLSKLLEVNPTCAVWYVEASQKMLRRAQKEVHIPPTTSVYYIHGTEQDIPMDVEFNVVITNFFFDLFSPSSLPAVIRDITKSIAGNGILLVSEFTKNSVWWQSLLLEIMYRFFRFACSIEASQLPDWQNVLREVGFTERKSSPFYRGFIKSSVYTFQKI